MRSAGVWFLILLAACVIGAYAFGVRPRSRRDWVLVALTIAFLAWLLPLTVPVR